MPFTPQHPDAAHRTPAPGAVRGGRPGVPADPGDPHLLAWAGQDAGDEARVRAELLELLSAPDTAAPPGLPGAPGLPPLPPPSAAGRYRAAVVATPDRAAAAVGAAKAVATGRPRPVALLFPGQGAQHQSMARGLYGFAPHFTEAADAALDLMGPLGAEIRADWLSDTPLLHIDDVRRSQPLLFVVGYALARLLQSWGVRPAALLGHSVGEVVAATLAEVIPLADAAEMIRVRVEHAARIGDGGMLAVAAAEETVLPYLRDDVAVAAVNTPTQTMLAGPGGPLAAVAAALRGDGYAVAAVPSATPFHSPAMVPAARALAVAYRTVAYREPQLPLYSGYTGTLMTAKEALQPSYWASQLTDTVRFSTALDQLLAADDVLLVESGPRQTLSAFARRHSAVRLGASAVLPVLPAKGGSPREDRAAVLGAAARIWTEGHDLDMDAVARLGGDPAALTAAGPRR